MNKNNISAELSLQNAECRTLKNGVKLYSLACNEFEVVRVSFVYGAGSVMQNTPFSATATANMMYEGSRDMTSTQIAEKLDYYGSYFDVNIDRDYSYISFCSLSKFVKPTLEVAEQIILYPTFPEEELITYRNKRKQRLAIERQKVETRAREAFAKSLFGEEHPYGISSDEKEYDNLTREDLIHIYNRLYIASNCFVVVSGKITDEVLELVERVASEIPQGEVSQDKNIVAVDFPEPQQRHYHLVEKADAVQSSIRIGRLLFTRTHPDFVGMQVLATILGGYFGSRLMKTLREERGYTYGVMSAMVNFAKSGYFAVATQVGVEVVDDALNLIYEQIELLRNEVVSDEELNMVKRIMIGEIMRILDGPFGVADVTIENILCERTNDAIAQNVEQIEAITAEELIVLAKKYLAFDYLVTVVSGSHIR
ncbi:MAG: pitrilysin family protein [Rikenellaceae bacterium]